MSAPYPPATPLRDRVVVKVANWLVRTFTTRQYQGMVLLTYRLGVRSLDRVLGTGQEPPQGATAEETVALMDGLSQADAWDKGRDSFTRINPYRGGAA